MDSNLFCPNPLKNLWLACRANDIETAAINIAKATTQQLNDDQSRIL